MGISNSLTGNLNGFKKQSDSPARLKRFRGTKAFYFSVRNTVTKLPMLFTGYSLWLKKRTKMFYLKQVVMPLTRIDGCAPI
jgi:hypothetical protein